MYQTEDLIIIIIQLRFELAIAQQQSDRLNNEIFDFYSDIY
ncbi:MAG: hypothetical protein V7K77_09430 [Nostoc sp.]